MAQSSLPYSIPMKGKGSYNAHSELQRDVLIQALRLLQDATKRANELLNDQKVLRVVEYGASHGRNSVPPLEIIRSATNRKQIAIDLNNRPENDFNTLSLTITDCADSLDKSKFPQDLFVSLRPRSFYKSLNVATTADLGYCFTCLHFLENIPTYLDCHFTATRSQETTQSIRNQAHLDLQKFLRHPATEFVPGGQLLLSFIASGFGHPDLFDSRPGECSRLAILEIDAEGRLPGRWNV